METTNRKIILPFGAAQKLAVALGVSQPTIRKALKFEESNNADEVSLAHKIRYNAVKNFGGVDTGAADVKVSGNVWNWDYDNGARLAINFKSGFVSLTFAGRMVDSAESISTSDIYDWQLKAENLKQCLIHN